MIIWFVNRVRIIPSNQPDLDDIPLFALDYAQRTRHRLLLCDTQHIRQQTSHRV